MNKIIKLSNGINIAIIGNVYPLLLDDAMFIPRYINPNNIPDIYVTGNKNVIKSVNKKTVMIADVVFDIADWVKDELDMFTEEVLLGNIDFVIANSVQLFPAYNYLRSINSSLELYTFDVLDNVNGMDIARINLFLKFNLNLPVYDNFKNY